MQKHLYILFSLVCLLLCGSCADEFEWQGVSVSSDEYLIGYAVSGPTEVTVATRSGEVDRDEVRNLTLIMFDKESKKMLKQPVYFSSSDINDSWTYPGNDAGGNHKHGTITVKKSDVASGTWYLVANASSQVKEIASADLDETDFLELIKNGTESCEFLDEPDASRPDDYRHVMMQKQGITVSDDTQQTAEVFWLERMYAQVSVYIAKSGLPFRLTKARLSRYQPLGYISKNQSQTVTDNNVATDDYSASPEDPRAWRAKADGSYCTLTDSLTSCTYPYTRPSVDDYTKKILMIVYGDYYVDRDNDPDNFTPCYYAIELPDMLANRHYKVKIIGATSAGYESPEVAEKNPGGLAVVFEDDSKNIHSIITDGANVLAVVDTITIPAQGVSGAAPKEDFFFKARMKGTANLPATQLEIRKKAGSPDDDWLNVSADEEFRFGTAAVSSIAASEEESDNSLFSSKFSYTLSAKENKGSERYSIYTVKLAGTKLERDVVVLQKANENINYAEVADIRLTITPTNHKYYIKDQDYYAFVNPKIGGKSGDEPLVKGIKPEQNGGRIRNLGLHAPMPSGNVTYTYTITPRNGAKVDGSATAKTYAFKDSDTPEGGTDEYSYVINPDKILIESKDGVEYTLDVYHTGFFHNAAGQTGSNWYYYEVMRQDDRDLYWLDRNLGATSAGMSVRDGSTVFGSNESSWPIVGDAAFGDYYQITEHYVNNSRLPDCPEGWDLPSYAQIRSLTTSTNFTITRRTSPVNRAAYFAPVFSFSGKEGGQSIRVSSYFPAGMYQENGSSYSGDDKSGFYMTTTGAGSANWYQVMQFVGVNASTQNMEFKDNKKKVLVRCCAGGYNPNTAAKLNCSVKGYTHVFLYYDNGDGSKTYLTTWPGEQISIYNATELDRYHPFELSTSVAYKQANLRVIFNKVNSAGERVGSNVSEADVAARKGVQFCIGGKYTYLTPDGGCSHDLEMANPNSPFVASNTAHAIEGHWHDTGNGGVIVEDDSQYSGEKFRLKFNFNGGNSSSGLDWHIGDANYQFTESATTKGVYTLTFTMNSYPSSVPSPDSRGDFVIVQAKDKNNPNWGEEKDASENYINIVEWKHNAPTFEITDGGTYTMAHGNNDQNWKLPLQTGVTWKITMNWKTKRFKIEKVSGDTPTPTTKTVTYALRLPICAAEKSNVNDMYLVLVNKKASDGSDEVVCAWPGVKMEKSTDNKYYYYNGTMTIPNDKTPADYFKQYLIKTNGNEDDNSKTTNSDVLWSAGKHSGSITDASAKSACGNPDYLYTIWAVSSSEPIPMSVPERKLYITGPAVGGWGVSREMTQNGFVYTATLENLIGDWKIWDGSWDFNYGLSDNSPTTANTEVDAKWNGGNYNTSYNSQVTVTFTFNPDSEGNDGVMSKVKVTYGASNIRRRAPAAGSRAKAPVTRKTTRR